MIRGWRGRIRESIYLHRTAVYAHEFMTVIILSVLDTHFSVNVFYMSLECCSIMALGHCYAYIETPQVHIPTLFSNDLYCCETDRISKITMDYFPNVVVVVD